MKIQKTHETIHSDLKAGTQTVERAEFVITDDDGRNIGSISANQYTANLNLNVQGTSIEGNVAKLAALTGAEIIEEGGAK